MTAEAAAGTAPGQNPKDEKMKNMTKRQKRKQDNEKNKWPQHPKIQDMDVRSKAYIRVAGLGSSSRQKEKIDPKLDLMSPEVKFGRLLASTDQRKRHLAVQKLKEYLKARCDINNENGGFSELDLLKLWKGLWYTLYMADRVPVQEELSKHLAELLWCVAGTEEEDEYAGQVYLDMCEEEETGEDSVDEDDGSDSPEVTLEEVENTLDHDSSVDVDDSEEDKRVDQAVDEGCSDGEEMIDSSEIRHCRGAHLASLFVRTFFRTVRREWGRMDKYRVDKFYSLSRLYVHQIYLYMAMRHWNIGIIRLFNDAYFEEVLSQKPNGLRYHLIDIALDELAKVNAKAPMQLTEATFLDVMEPYFAMCQTGAGGDVSIQGRVIEAVLEKFLNKYSFVADEATSEDSSAAPLVFEDVHVGTIAQFIFELASDEETKDQFRKSMYDMHKAYMRRLKKAGRDVNLEEEDTGDIVDNDDDSESLNGDESEGNLESRIEDKEHSDEDKEVPGDLAATPIMPVKEGNKKRRKSDEVIKRRESVDTQAKKKQKKAARRDQAANHDRVEEEEVTITVGEQKMAHAFEKNKKKAKNMQDKKEKSLKAADGTDSTDKRVKWLPNNRSKSYKASMKGLVSATPPKTSEVTPEKGILLNKGKVRRAGLSKAGRKKAVNYF